MAAVSSGCHCTPSTHRFGQLDALDGAVVGPCRHRQPVAEMVDALVVDAVADGPLEPPVARASRLPAATATAWSSRRWPSMCWCSVPAARHVQQLGTPADRQHRQVEVEGDAERRRLEGVLAGIDAPDLLAHLGGAVRRGSMSPPPSSSSPSKRASVAASRSVSAVGARTAGSPPARRTASR